MSKMIDMIRQSAVPASVLRTASLGALSLPPDEMLEILVELTRNPIFGKQARITLSSFDVDSVRTICADPSAPEEVIDYFLDARNRRNELTKALIENWAVSEGQVAVIAMKASSAEISILLESARVREMPSVLNILLKNPHVSGPDYSKIEWMLGIAPVDLQVLQHSGQEDPQEAEALRTYETEHAEEIKAERDKAFELVRGSPDEVDEVAATLDQVQAKLPVHRVEEEPERVSTIQKIARMTVGERVQLAMKGSKDERFVLIRDGSKVVSLAVLESPKLSDAEMETFASMKNVQEVVLRAISTKRKFMKQYSVIRALTNNPRCPMDVSLGLLPHLMVRDLQILGKNKNVGETLRKVAIKIAAERNKK